jgi:hypothetical protein
MKKAFFEVGISLALFILSMLNKGPVLVKKILRKEVTDMAMEKSMASSSLAEVVDRILDKGIVVDAWVRVSLVGIELLAVEARAVVAGVETYLKYAEAVGLTATA